MPADVHFDPTIPATGFDISDFDSPTFHLLGDLLSILSHFGKGIFDVFSDFLVGPTFLVRTGVQCAE